MTGVQLIGKGAVIAHYEGMSNAQSWALLQGKQFIVSGNDIDGLSNWLTSLERTGTTARYNLRIYDTEEVVTSSNFNSDYIACLGFTVIDNYEGQGIAGHSTKLVERLGAIENRLKEREKEEEEDEEEPEKPEIDLPGIIMGWLSDPVKLGQVVGVVKQILGSGVPIPVPALSAQTVGSTEPAQPSQETREETVDRLAAALDQLETRDPKLVDHLEKLAKLSQSDPDTFKLVIAKLDVL